MPTDDLNIEAKLNFSKRLGGLIKGHQQEMQQVLKENEDLQMLVEQLLSKILVYPKKMLYICSQNVISSIKNKYETTIHPTTSLY